MGPRQRVAKICWEGFVGDDVDVRGVLEYLGMGVCRRDGVKQPVRFEYAPHLIHQFDERVPVPTSIDQARNMLNEVFCDHIIKVIIWKRNTL